MGPISFLLFNGFFTLDSMLTNTEIDLLIACAVLLLPGIALFFYIHFRTSKTKPPKNLIFFFAIIAFI
jgi:hypothetical protein